VWLYSPPPPNDSLLQFAYHIRHVIHMWRRVRSGPDEFSFTDHVVLLAGLRWILQEIFGNSDWLRIGRPRNRFPAGVRDLSFPHIGRTGSGAYTASCSVGTGDSFPGGKAAGAWIWPLPFSADDKNAWIYTLEALCHDGWRRRSPVMEEAANILNKQSRTADKGWSSSLVGHGANNSSL
jgi:hypothetical protein